MKKILFGVGVIAIIILGIIKVSNIAQKPKGNSQKIRIVTTIFPLYDFAKNIGQDKVEVLLLLPPGVEPHSFEPKPSDIAKISEADIFIYTGKFMEPWAQDIIKGVSGKNVKIIDSSVGIKMIPVVFHNDDELKGSMDPHIWLDFDNAKTMVQTIVQAISEKDKNNANYYQQKADEYKNKLFALDVEYKTSLSKCKSTEIVYGGHYAFGYLSKRYNLKYLSAQGVSPDAQPTAQNLVQLVEQIKKDNIKYVFYEELTSSKIAETLANETKAKLLLLSAAHNLTKKDFENNVSFLSIMEKNLINLKIGLQYTD
ncbi:MAG: zinc ABC transporter substrate-binding protein [Candidatus Firestonebacteria bacterium]